jgi:hypothetical protein
MQSKGADRFYQFPTQVALELKPVARQKLTCREGRSAHRVVGEARVDPFLVQQRATEHVELEQRLLGRGRPPVVRPRDHLQVGPKWGLISTGSLTLRKGFQYGP